MNDNFYFKMTVKNTSNCRGKKKKKKVKEKRENTINKSKFQELQHITKFSLEKKITNT